MYEVIRPIAAGHQGHVDLARAVDGSLVALKRLAVEGSPAERDVARRRLRREAELLQGVEIDGVIPLLDVIEERGESGELEVVLVMPYLPGGSLHDRVASAGPLPAERVAELAVPLLGALAALHRRGVLHRDVKPANVLFDAVDGGRPCLIDFGIGIGRDFTAGLSAADALIGTPSFIAPERARGEAATPASDIYSLGATLRYAITGMPPHGVGDLVSVVGRAAAGRIEPLPPGTDPQLVEVLDRMCALDPADRPTAAELLPGPEGTFVRGGIPTPVHSIDTAPARHRSRWLTALGAAVLLVIGVATGVVVATQLGGNGDSRTSAAADTVEVADTTSTTEPAPTTTRCEPQPYQGCDDDEPAPGTDGTACLAGRFDHDGNAANGCEAVDDDIDETRFTSGTIEGTIIPEGDVDKVLVPVTDRWQLLCDARFQLTLTAPSGLDLEMTVFDDGRRIAQLEVAGGTSDRVRLAEPSCARNDSTTLEVVIRAVDGRSSEPWVLERSGSW